MSDIKKRNAFDNENHFLNYIAMKKRIEKRNKKVPHMYNYSSTIHEYFINHDDIYKRKCNNTYEWKTRPTFLFREKVNDFLLSYYYRIYNKEKHCYDYHRLYHDYIFNDLENDNISSDSNSRKSEKLKDKEIIIRKEEEIKQPTSEDYEKILEKKYLRIIRILFLNIINEKCIYKEKHLYILLNDIIDIIKTNKLYTLVNFTKLKKIILSDFKLNEFYDEKENY